MNARTLSTAYTFIFGGVSSTLVPSSGGSGLVCAQVYFAAADSTHQQALQLATNNAAGTLSNAQENAFTANLGSTNAINFQQAAAGTTDVYTAYLFSVDLY